MEKILGYIDLLGFSQMVNTDESKAREILNDFYNISYTEIKGKQDVKGHLFSDSLLIYSENKPELINCLAAIYQKCLLKNGSYSELSKFFLLPRGALSVGIVNIVERDESPNLSKNFIISHALVHSAKMESLVKGSRLLIAIKNDEQQRTQLDWNTEIRFSLYQDDAFTLLKGYHYKDILWFSSLENGENERNKLIELIDITIQLLNANANNKTVFAQHIWTLRIGLLSYTKYLGQENDPLIKKIIEQFSDDKYWLIWITLFEIIVNSCNEWKYASNSLIVDFYKKSCLTNGWVQLLKEIHKKGNEYSLKCLQKFLDEIQIQTI